MTAGLHDMAKMTVSGTPGTGPITLGIAVAGFQSFAAAGVVDGEVVPYSLADSGNAWEVGYGTYSSSGPAITRTPKYSSNSNAAVSLTSNAIIWISALAETLTRGGDLHGEDFGIVADYNLAGSIGNGTNNTSALLAAITAASMASTNGLGAPARLILPPGVIRTDPIVLANQIVIEGCSWASTVLIVDNNSALPAVTILPDLPAQPPGQPNGTIALRNLCITSEGGKGQNTTCHGVCVRLGPWRPSVVIDNVRIYNMPADGYQCGPRSGGTSTTSLTIGTGAKTFTTAASLGLIAGETLWIWDTADTTKWMRGTVTSYSGTSLVMNITSVGGSGTIATWTIGGTSNADVTAHHLQLFNNGANNCNLDSCFDHVMFRPDFGDAAANGLVCSSVDNCEFYGLNVYSSALSNILLYGNNDVKFFGGASDQATQNNVTLSNSTAVPETPKFFDMRFTNAGTDVAHNWVDVWIDQFCTGGAIEFHACKFGNLNQNGGINPIFNIYHETDSLPVEVVLDQCRSVHGDLLSSNVLSPNSRGKVQFSAPGRPSSPRNLLWGGNFNTNPNQFGASVSLTGISTAWTWITDGWGGYAGSGASMSASLQTDGSDTVLQFGRPNSNTNTTLHAIGHWLPYADIRAQVGKFVTISADVKEGAGFSGSHAATLYLVTGTAADEGSSGLTGAWTGRAVASQAVTTTTGWTRVFVTLLLPSTAQEAAVLIGYTPGGTATTDYLRVKNIQLEVGMTPTEYEDLPACDVMRRAQVYYEMSYNPGSIAGTVTSVGASTFVYSSLVPSQAASFGMQVFFRETKFKTPTITTYSTHGTGASGMAYSNSNAVDKSTSQLSVGRNGFLWYINDTTPAAPGQEWAEAHWTADARP